MKLSTRLALRFALIAGLASSGTPAAPIHGSSGSAFDISRVPFSCFGSYFSISRYGERVLLRCLHGGVTPELFQLELLREGRPIPFKEVATPAELTLRPTEGGGQVEVVFAEPDLMRVRGRGVGLRFVQASIKEPPFVFRRGESGWVINETGQDIKLMVTPLAGRLDVSSEVNMESSVDVGSGSFELAIEEFSGSWHKRVYAEPFDSAVDRLRTEYASWRRWMPSVPTEFQAAAELATYINWSAVVGAEGSFHRPAMLMSKNWMTKVWTWDHAFNAMAMINAQPELAWDQFFLPFEFQNADGALPDTFTDRTTTWAFSKPPIHGCALNWMLRHGGRLDRAGMIRAYDSLSASTNWYFRFRDDDNDGLPEYQHGCDSGWDNATVFAKGIPVESPDLAALLAVQMDELGDLAGALGKDSERLRWRAKADELLDRMMKRMWRGDHFVALAVGEHDKDIDSNSLLPYIPLLLGKRLPPEISGRMVARLREEGLFLTKFGLASESPRSKDYVADGYWLGPIWAPSTMLIVSGLDDLGEHTLARDLRERFCRMAAAGGMAENFDALTGKPLRDPAYTWTSSVFLIFAAELTNQRR